MDDLHSVLSLNITSATAVLLLGRLMTIRGNV